MTIQAYRAKILHFANDKDPAHSARFEEDGLLVIGPKSNSGAKDKQVVLICTLNNPDEKLLPLFKA